MADVGRLNYKITADATAFERGMSKAKAAVKSLAVGFGAMSAVAAGVGVAVKKALDVADNLAKTSRAVGVSVTLLQALRHSATLAGGSTERLDAAMLRFTKRLGELKGGMGSLYSVLKKTNPEVAQMLADAENSDQALEILFQALLNTKSGAEQMALAAAAVGRDFAATLIEMAKNANGSTENIRADFAKLGRALSEGQVRAAEAANDALQKLSDTFSISLTGALVDFAPRITAVANWLREGIPKAVQFAARAFDFLQGIVEGTAANALKLMQILGFGDFQAEIANLKAGESASYARAFGQAQPAAGPSTQQQQPIPSAEDYRQTELLIEIRDGIRHISQARAG